MHTASRALLLSSKQTQVNIGTLTVGLLIQLTREWRAGKLTDREFITAFIAAEKLGHDQAAQAMTAFIKAFREAQTPGQEHAEPVPAEFDPGASLGRATGLVDDVHQLDLAQPDGSEILTRTINEAAARAYRHALAGGRDTMVRSAAANNTRWRRVTGPTACAFCVMLATRSDYLSKESASQVTEGRGTRRLGERYHNRCSCTVVEVIGEWEPSEREQAQQRLYRAAVDHLQQQGKPRTPANVMSAMRQLDDGKIVQDATVKTQTGGSGGGAGKRPGRRQAGDDPGKARPPRERSEDSSRDWQAEQDALPFSTAGATMKPHEIEFAQSFTAAGHSIARWLPQGTRGVDGRVAPSNDFEWSAGKEVELKRSNNLQTIKDHIKKGLRQGKSVFLIDFGSEPRSSVLRGLRTFTPRTPGLSEIWVYWDGHLERVQ